MEIDADVVTDAFETTSSTGDFDADYADKFADWLTPQRIAASPLRSTAILRRPLVH